MRDRYRLYRRLRKAVAAWMGATALREPLEPMLHASATRLRGIGVFIIANHLLFCMVWLWLHPETFDSVALRLAMAATGIPLVLGGLHRQLTSTRAQWVLCVVIWANLPLLFSFMFVMNDGSGIRLASMTGVLLVYYQLTDWRIATLGSLLGTLLGAGMACLLHTPHFAAPYPAFAVLGTFWAGAVFLGMSRQNLRREQFRQTVHTMTVMSNDVRPAIAAMAVVGKALRSESQASVSKAQAERLYGWGGKLLKLSGFLRATLSSQVANAHLLEMGLPGDTELLFASALVRDACTSYPHLKYSERDCVEISVRRDFSFVASRRQFTQVLGNLIRNGLEALAATGRTLQKGDLLIEVCVLSGRGRIIVTDRGVGMSPETLQRAFEAFYSTNKRSGHGLGLTFCRQIVESAGGTIEVESVWGFGACFTIEFPRISSASANGNNSESFGESDA